MECLSCGSDLHQNGDLYYCDECGAEFTYEDLEVDYVDETRWDHEDYSCDFADPGGRSALRAATPSNPRNLPCPTCGRENMLTPKDRALHYQCDICADRAERGGY